MDINAYLRRINWTDPVSVDATTLRRLHVAHLRAVPFENLSIHWGEPIVLGDDALFEKIVTRRRGGFGPDFDHMILLVRLEQRYLVDVGFGDSFLKPLRLDERGEQIEAHRTYRIAQKNDQFVMTRRDGAGDWMPQYRFTLDAYDYGAYQAMCHYHQTSPQSHFTQQPICSLATADGRITISGMKFITTVGRNREERAIQSAGEREGLLRECFGISRN